MKKISYLVAIVLCLCLLFVSCGKPAENTNIPELPDNTQTETTPDVTEPFVVNVGTLKGPTSIGLVKVMEDESLNAGENYVYDFKIEASADALTPLFIDGKLDMIAVPANLASVLYNKTNGETVVLNINTLGVLYIVENGETVNSVSDLKGKTIYASGKGSTPEYGLMYMLENSGLVVGKDVFVEFKAEHAECVAAIINEPNAVAMLPQPFATTAIIQNPSIRIALDINEAWEDITGKTLVTGVMIARKAFVEEHPDAVSDFLAKYEESVEYVNQNIVEAAVLVEKYVGFKTAVAEKAIPYCQVSFIDGEEMKTALSDYLGVLYGQNNKAVGGKLPADDFYYIEG